MRIAIFCTTQPGGNHGVLPDAGGDSEISVRVRSVLESARGLGPAELMWLEGDRPFLKETAAADVLVLGLPDGPSAPQPWFRKLPPGVSKVLVVPDPPAAALAFRAFPIEEIVPAGRLEGELPSALRRAYAATTVGRAVSLVRGLDLVSTIGRWCLRVLTAPLPYAQVKASTRRPDALRKAWNRTIGRSGPKEFLRWILLVRAVGLKRPDDDWRSVARLLRVSLPILTHAAEALMGTGLDGLPADGGQEVRRRFEEYLRSTMLLAAR